MTLIRTGQLPLDYHLVLISLVWFLKGYGGSSPLLQKTYLCEKDDDERWSKSPFFRPAEVMLTRLNSLSEVDLFKLEPHRAKYWIRKAMCIELNEMWHSNGHSLFSKRIYPNWVHQPLSSLMLTKISTTWYHQIACGRGYLKSKRAEYYSHISPQCRFGCHSDETPTHIFLHCPVLVQEQHNIKNVCKHYRLPYTISTIFTEDVLKLKVEQLLLKLILHN